jgi:hypothetical protein
MARLNVNGQVVEAEVEESTPLLWVIREQLGLTGTKYGCGRGAVRRLARSTSTESPPGPARCPSAPSRPSRGS